MRPFDGIQFSRTKRATDPLRSFEDRESNMPPATVYSLADMRHVNLRRGRHLPRVAKTIAVEACGDDVAASIPATIAPSD